MKNVRCDEVIVQLIVREYDAAGQPIGEQTSQPVKVFRATTPDFWAGIDSTVKANPPQADEKPKKKRGH